MTAWDAHRLTDLPTRPRGTRETKRDLNDAQQGLRLVSETLRDAGDGGDVRRSAHNPEVEGSNPSPATKARRLFLEQRKGLLHVVCHGRAPSDYLPTPMIRSAIGFVAPAFAARS